MKELFKFIDFTHKFQQVQRVIYATGVDRNEDDADHSFQLALVAWYLKTSQDLKFNEDKLIKYALIHDLVETYAGDTYFHTTDKKLRNSKHKREMKALEKIRKNFPEFPEISEWIEEYEFKKDKEAKFIYALDKILPVINIYMDSGRSWQRDKVTYEMIRTKDELIAVSPEATKIWNNLIELLDKNPQLFTKNPN